MNVVTEAVKHVTTIDNLHIELARAANDLAEARRQNVALMKENAELLARIANMLKFLDEEMK
jgi:hypothetical protein